MPVAPFQYLESHDHSQLIAFAAGTPNAGPFANRDQWYRLQPFVIALYTCEGIPMLWQGQEFADNYVLPASGDARIHFRHDAHWEYFYDDQGSPLVRLYRIVGALRRTVPALRSRESFYYNANSRPGEGAIVYRRNSTSAGQVALVFLNFSDLSQSLTVPVDDPGTYREMIDNDVRSRPFEISVAAAGQLMRADVPPHYGFIFVRSS
jgi:1,4-alpha-glucan branching enzyme